MQNDLIDWMFDALNDEEVNAIPITQFFQFIYLMETDYVDYVMHFASYLSPRASKCQHAASRAITNWYLHADITESK